VVDRSLAVKVFIRDDWKCRYCGNRERLHPHHIKFKSQGRKDSLDNLVTLCSNCHRRVHDGKLKIKGQANGDPDANFGLVWSIPDLFKK